MTPRTTRSRARAADPRSKLRTRYVANFKLSGICAVLTCLDCGALTNVAMTQIREAVGVSPWRVELGKAKCRRCGVVFNDVKK